MEIKAQLRSPYTKEQRRDFIVLNNHRNGYNIVETETALEAWGYTEDEQAQQHRQYLDSLTLTPADVERALYKEKQIDFEDLKILIAQAFPQIDIKGLSIEFRAKDFFRGAEANGMRLFDVVGQLLGYTSEDMDYLFEHKELPEKIEEEQSEEVEVEEELPEANEDGESDN